MRQNLDDLLILCINLKSSHERRVRMERMADDFGIKLQFVEGANAEDARSQSGSPRYNSERRHKSFAADLTPGEQGCVISHYRALSQFLASNHQHVLILEDNAQLLKNFSTVLNQLDLQQVGFDLLRLETRKRSALNLTILEQSDFKLNVSPRVSLGTTAIIFSRPGAAKVVKSLDSYFRAYDAHLGRFWQHGLTILTMEPPIVVRASLGEVASMIWAQNAKVGVQPSVASETMPVLGLRWLRNRSELWFHECAKQVVALQRYAGFKFGLRKS